MIVEITPLQDIGKVSFRIANHYLGKDKKRNTFIVSASELIDGHLVYNDGSKFVGSEAQSIRLYNKKQLKSEDWLIEKGVQLLQEIFLALGDFYLTVFECDQAPSNNYRKININDVKMNMPIIIGETVLITKNTNTKKQKRK